MINSDDLKKINDMSDEVLSSKISKAASVAGIKELRLSTADIEKIRKAVASLDAKDVERITQNVDAATLEAIKNSLNE